MTVPASVGDGIQGGVDPSRSFEAFEEGSGARFVVAGDWGTVLLGDGTLVDDAEPEHLTANAGHVLRRLFDAAAEAVRTGRSTAAEVARVLGSGSSIENIAWDPHVAR